MGRHNAPRSGGCGTFIYGLLALAVISAAVLIIASVM